ncbi:hypothetical protein CRG98_025297 [Punica granatum]|uniref:Uncharacterized protein n=1 Tax=Punica granatum TaxID=22663 RepID=A0A2I0JF65_PUNGR|nr:hypothetical protein CRG98_025297 [Punica granatum]
MAEMVPRIYCAFVGPELRDLDLRWGSWCEVVEAGRREALWLEGESEQSSEADDVSETRGRGAPEDVGGRRWVEGAPEYTGGTPAGVGGGGACVGGG